METVASVVASTLLSAGFEVATCVPGLGGIQCYSEFERQRSREPRYSFHEEIAFSVAYGAAIAGVRSCSFLKSHGIAKAMNIAVNASVAGVNAACLIFVFDDPNGESSDTALDAEQVVRGSGLRYRIPKVSRIAEEILEAIRESEQNEEVQVIILQAKSVGEAASQSDRTIEKPLRKPYDRAGYPHLLCPPLSLYHRDYREWIRSGRRGPKPAPPKVGPIPDALPESIRQSVEGYQPFFDYFKSIRGEMVIGDTSLSLYFAFPPYQSVDTCLQMGGSIPTAIGVWEAGVRDVWVVSGDFSFLSMGPIALLEAVERGCALKIVIFHNGLAAATGKQPVSSEAFARALVPYSKYTRYIRTPQEISTTVDEANQAEELRILVYQLGRCV